MHKLARCSSWHRLQLVSLGMLDPGSSLLTKTLHLPPASQALGVPNLALACLPTFSTPQLSTQDNFSSFGPGAPLPAAQPLGPALPQTWPAAAWHLGKRTRSNRDCSELHHAALSCSNTPPVAQRASATPLRPVRIPSTVSACWQA